MATKIWPRTRVDSIVIEAGATPKACFLQWAARCGYPQYAQNRETGSKRPGSERPLSSTLCTKVRFPQRWRRRILIKIEFWYPTSYGWCVEAWWKLLSVVEMNSYKVIYRAFWETAIYGCKVLVTLTRPAGLEPATPCLEGRFGQRMKNPSSLGKIRLLCSSRYARVVEACWSLWSFEDLTSTKLSTADLDFKQIV